MAFKKEKELRNKSTNKTVKNTSTVAKESAKAGAKTAVKAGAKFLSKKAIIAIILSATVAVTSGLGLGLGFGLKDKGNDTPPGNPNEIFALASTSIKAPEGVTPEDVTDAKMNAFHAFYAMNEMDSFVSHSVGATKSTGYTQNIKSRRVVSGNEIFKESISHSSLVKVGRRFFITGNNYIIHEADKVSSVDSVSWSNSASRISEEDYINAYGYVPSSITGYLFTEETILSAEYLGFNDGLYSFKYQLDPAEATKAMVIEMRTMANAKDYPVFERAELTIRMDENFIVKETVTNCRYKAKGFNCEENVTETFSDFNQGEIPNAEFYRQYLDADISQQPDGPEQPATPVDYLAGGFAEYITGEKPLKANIDVQGTSTPISVDADVELNINMEDLSALTARVNVNSIAYSDLSLNDLFIGYQNNKVYLSIADFKGYGDIEQMSSIIENLIPLFVSDTTDISNVLGDINLDSLMEDMTLERKDGVATVSLPLSLAGLDINASLIFDDGDTIAFNKAVITLGDVTITATPDNDINVEQIDTATYNNVAPLFDIIDQNNNVNLTATIEDVTVDLSINLIDLTVIANADIYGKPLYAKFQDQKIYISFLGFNGYINVNDINGIIEKITAIIGQDISTDLEIDVDSVVSALTITENNGILTIATNLLGADVGINILSTDNTYTIKDIKATFGEIDIEVKPTTRTQPLTIPEGKYFNITPLLNIIDNNNEIDLTANAFGLDIDVNINLSTFVINAKTNLYGKDLLVKFEDNKIYLSYLGLNAYFDINDIDKVMDKIATITGSTEIALPDTSNITVQSVLDGITVTNGDDLTINAKLFGFDFALALSTTDGNLEIKSISAKGEGIEATVKPASKKTYQMSNGKYYNIVSLLDVIDDNGQITLDIAIDNVNIKATLDLTDMSLRAKLEDLEIYALLNTGDIYARYPGVLAHVNLNDIDDILTTLQPLIDKFAGEGTIPEINLDGGLEIDVETLLSTVKVVESANALSISLEFEGVGVTANFDCNGQNLSLNNVSLDVEDLAITARPDNVPLNFTFDLNLDYIDLKALVDDFGSTLVEVLTSSTLYVSASASIDLGNGTVYNVKEITIQIDNLDTAPRGNATFTLEIIENNVVKSTHTIRLVYLDPSLVGSGNTNVYFTYDNKADTNKLEGVFNTEKAETTLDIVKQIYTNMPVIQDLLKPIIVPDANGEPTMPETDIDIAKVINLINYVANVISIDVNGSVLMDSMPSSIKTNLTNVDNALVLDIPALSLDGMVIKFNAGIKVADEGSITDDTFNYTTSNASDFSSINELLETFMNTSQHRSFHLSGNVNMNAIGIDIKDKIYLDAKIDMDADNNVFAVASIKRYEFALAWDDKGGTATYYYDPIEEMLYIHDNYVKNEKVGTILGFLPKYEDVTYNKYYKYTIDEFMADAMNIILDTLHLSSTIRDLITDSTTNESTTATSNPTIESIFLKYSYNGSNKFTFNVDLEPLIKDIQTLDLDIYHDSDMYVESLSAKCKMVSVIELSLNASIAKPYNQYQGTPETIASLRTNQNYK